VTSFLPKSVAVTTYTLPLVSVAVPKGLAKRVEPPVPSALPTNMVTAPAGDTFRMIWLL
jgi:hypothetical protein